MSFPLPAIPEAQQLAIDERFARRLATATAVQRLLHDEAEVPAFSQAAEPAQEPA